MTLRSFAVALVLLAALPISVERVAAGVPTGPSAFGTDSATLSHPYYPVSVGDVMVYSGYGGYRGDLRLESAVAVETIDDVECLLLVRDVYWSRWDETDGVQEFQSTQRYWFAQDVDGNVWILGYAAPDGIPLFFGAREPILKLPAELQVGDAWRYLYGDALQVVSISPLSGLRNGLGPFSDCVHTRLARGSGTFENLYYAPTVGVAYFSFHDEGWSTDRPGWVEGYERVLTDALEPGPGTIQFAAAEFRAVEGQYWFQAAVTRSGGNEGVVSVLREVTQSTAATNPGIFFYDVGRVYLAPGQSSLTFDVRLNNDDIWSHQRTMALALSEPGGGASLGELKTATVTVEDDENGEDSGEFIGPCFLNLLKLW